MNVEIDNDEDDDDDETPSGVLRFSKDIASEPKPPILPPGKYAAEVRKVTVKPDKNDNARIHVQFFIDPSDYPVDFRADNAPDGTFVNWANLVYEDTPTARYRIAQFCRKIDAPASREVDTTDWIGCTCVVQVRHGSYLGEKTLEVQQIFQG